MEEQIELIMQQKSVGCIYTKQQHTKLDQNQCYFLIQSEGHHEVHDGRGLNFRLMLSTKRHVILGMSAMTQLLAMNEY